MKGSHNYIAYLCDGFSIPCFKNSALGLGVVVYACDPSYLGGGIRKITSRGQLVRPYLKNKMGMVVLIYNPSYLEGGGKRVVI
jgi:hypothetical protein